MSDAPVMVGEPLVSVRVHLSAHLRTLAKVDGELELEVGTHPTLTTVLDALEARHPVLKGTIRNYATGRRRDFIRFFACGRDLSHDPAEARLPEAVSLGGEALHVVGAIAGG